MSGHCESNHRCLEHWHSSHRCLDYCYSNHRCLKHCQSNHRCLEHCQSNHRCLEHCPSNHRCLEHQDSHITSTTDLGNTTDKHFTKAIATVNAKNITDKHISQHLQIISFKMKFVKFVCKIVHHWGGGYLFVFLVFIASLTKGQKQTIQTCNLLFKTPRCYKKVGNKKDLYIKP